MPDYQALLTAIGKRCDQADIEFSIENSEGSERHFLAVQLPAGRKTRPVVVGTPERAAQLLAVDFENWVFLGDYEAVCSYKTGTIKAHARPLRPAGLQRLAKATTGGYPERDALASIDLSAKGPNGTRCRLSAVQASDPLHVLALKPWIRKALALQISGLSIDRHDDALQLLEGLANAMLFDIDIRTDAPVTLEKHRAYRRGPRREAPEQTTVVPFPKQEYDPEPMSLYWYARGAVGMPLLRFLAYYQVLEFYFASYSEQEARRRIANIVKKPNFDPHGERDLSRIFNAAVAGGRGRYGDEKTQLRATVQGCVDPDDLREFLSHDEATQAFFKEKISGLTDVILKANASDDQLLDAVASRIYDIRCKIVHSKEASSGEEVGLLLPFSREAEQLAWDIHLMEHLARAALIARSRPLTV